MTPQKIPHRLNGYDIVAQIHRILPSGTISDSEVYLLGHDRTRRTGAYVTAAVGILTPHPIREWYWGHYFEDMGAAYRSLLHRANMALAICDHKTERDQLCNEITCPNYFDNNFAWPR